MDDTPTRGSPKSGSACSNPKYSYLSEVIPDWGNLFTLPELYLVIYLIVLQFRGRLKVIQEHHYHFLVF